MSTRSHYNLPMIGSPQHRGFVFSAMRKEEHPELAYMRPRTLFKLWHLLTVLLAHRRLSFLPLRLWFFCNLLLSLSCSLDSPVQPQ